MTMPITATIRNIATNCGLGYVYSFNGPHSLFCDTIRSLRALAMSHRLGHVFGQSGGVDVLTLRGIGPGEVTRQSAEAVVDRGAFARRSRPLGEAERGGALELAALAEVRAPEAEAFRLDRVNAGSVGEAAGARRDARLVARPHRRRQQRRAWPSDRARDGLRIQW